MKTQDHSKPENNLASIVASKTPTFQSAGRYYEIHIKGHLNPIWSDWLEGLEMELLNNGEMILSGLIIDQAALLGVLNKLNHLNLAILSVNEVKKEK